MPLFDKNKSQPEQQPQTGWAPPAPQPQSEWPTPQTSEPAGHSPAGRGFGKALQAGLNARTEAAHYATSVNKGSRNMAALAGELNQRWNAGWRLHTVFEKDGNTVCVYERRD